MSHLRTLSQCKDEVAKTDTDLICEFMGYVRKEADKTYNKARYLTPMEDKRKDGEFVCYYDCDGFSRFWDWLMPVCKKWDDLPLLPFKGDLRLQYSALSDDLDHYVSCYEIIPAYTQLVKCVKWYQAQHP